MADLIKTKMDLVFQRLSKLTSSVWRSEEVPFYSHHSDYVTYIKGQKIKITIDNLGKNKVKATLCIGKYGLDKCFYKSICFSILKAENMIFNDLYKRLEIDTLNLKIDEMLSARTVKQEYLDEFKHKIDVIKRFLPFEQGYKGTYHFFARYKGVRVDMEIGGYPHLSIDADEEFLMKLCAYIAELLKNSD